MRAALARTSSQSFWDCARKSRVGPGRSSSSTAAAMNGHPPGKADDRSQASQLSNRALTRPSPRGAASPGFTTCSMKFQCEAAGAIESLNLGDRFGIVHDTFQHGLAKDEDVLVPHIRVVHISGISGGSGDLTDAQDAERVLVGESDRTDTLGQMRRLLAAGYRGPFSIECTAPSVREREDLRRRSQRRLPICDTHSRQDPREGA